MIVSDSTFTPQAFVEMVTGNYYTTDLIDDAAWVRNRLNQNGISAKSYSLTETDKVIGKDVFVVLVNCLAYDKDNDTYTHKMRWFEIPQDRLGAIGKETKHNTNDLDEIPWVALPEGYTLNEWLYKLCSKEK